MPGTLVRVDYNQKPSKDVIPWTPYSIQEGIYKSRAYFLDRKDNSKGYSKDNCVVCCTICNKIKNCYLTHGEMLVAMKAVLEYRQQIFSN